MTAAVASTTEMSRTLQQALADISAAERDPWTMRAASRRSGGHGLFQYPAMMLPDLQGALLDHILAVDPTVERVLDPFAGSGTVLLESLRRGLNFRGLDLNPLAVLLCAVKGQTYRRHPLDAAFSDVIGQARGCRRRCACPDAAAAWFGAEALQQLGCLRSAIRRIPTPSLRRALWVCLAETVRRSSDSRTSTVKLHRLPKEVLEARAVDAIAIFEQVAAAHVTQLTAQSTALAAGRDDGGTRAKADCRYGDARTHRWRGTADVLMTSPPYGDNLTTVTYGQHSYLPLLWIDHDDIPGQPAQPANAYRVDADSLGGQLRTALEDTDRLSELSPAFARTAFALRGSSTNARKRLSAFFRDVDASLGPILAGLRPDGWMVWTLGERRIAGQHVPTVAVLRELLEGRGAREVAALERRIPAGRKRMAPRNGLSATMTAETILILRTASASSDVAR